MITTVTQKNMVTIPADISRKLGIVPGCRLEWTPMQGQEELRVRIIPKRGELARRLRGRGRRYSPERDAVRELIKERGVEG